MSQQLELELERDCCWTRKPLALNVHIFLFSVTVKSRLEANIGLIRILGVLWNAVNRPDSGKGLSHSDHNDCVSVVSNDLIYCSDNVVDFVVNGQ